MQIRGDGYSTGESDILSTEVSQRLVQVQLGNFSVIKKKGFAIVETMTEIGYATMVPQINIFSDYVKLLTM